MPRSPLPASTLVVIDPTVDDAQWLAAGVQEDAIPFILNAHRDGITQITDYLRQHPQIVRLVLVAHGQAGQLALGSTVLTADTIGDYPDVWALWNRQLRQIMIYGCQVAAQDVGQQFLEALHQKTGVAIAASTHPIGNVAQGGSWILDVQIGDIPMGSINLGSPFYPFVHQQYPGVLGTLVVNSADDNIIADDGQVTLREAIAAANGDTTTDLGDQGIGIDTIVFDAALAGSTINLSLGELQIDTSIILDGSTAPGIVISGNNASRVFSITGGTSTLNAVTIAEGAATNGAGIRVDDASLTLENSLLTGHVDAGSGGAIYADNATLVITNTTITGNTSADFGAGMTLDNGTDATVTFSTIANNQGSGIDRVGDSTLSIGHTLLADNTRGNIPLSSTNTTSLNYNLTDDITVGLNQNRDRIARSDADIRLGDLGDYGGPTQTLALLPGSLAIDTGDPVSSLLTDQRGVTRPIRGRITNRVDIGAFEAAIPLVTVDDLITDDNTPTLTGTVTLPGGVVVPGLDVRVTVGGATYTATNNGDGTWTLDGNTIDLLADGTYDVQVTATNVSGTGIDTTTNELLVDATPPVVTIDELSTNDPTPALTGIVDDPAATVTVTVNGIDYVATNIGDGTWILEEGSILDPLPTGTYDVVVTAIDALGNEGIDTTTNELVIDSISPEVAIAPRTTNDATPALTGLVDDATATVEVTLNRTTYTATNNGDGTWTLNDDRINLPLADGTYDVVVAATDAAGNVGTDSTTDELTIDTTPPEITVDDVLTRDQTPELTGTISEATSLIEITVNGNTYTANNNNDGTWSLPDDRIFPALNDGIYEVIARAVDEAGNEGFDTTTEELVVDNTPPTVTVTPLATNDPTPALTGTVNDPTATITVTLDDAVYTATNNEDGTWTLADDTITVPLADGSYNVLVTATDLLGNEGFDDTIDELVIDTESPEVTIDPLITRDSAPPLTGTVNDGTATVTVTVNGIDYIADNNGDGTWSLEEDAITPVLADGTYDVQVVATDSVGNEGTDDSTDELLIDTTAPEVFVDRLITNDPTPELTGTVNEAMATVEVTVNGVTYTATNNGDGIWTLADDTITELPNDTFDIVVRAIDRAGNEGFDGTTDELTVDAIAPTLTLDDLNTDDPSPELSGTIDDDTATIQVTVNRANYTATNNGNGTWTLANNTIPDLDDGTYEVIVSAADAATNVGTDTATLLIDTVAPVVTVDELSTNDSTPELTGTISEPNASIEVTVNGVPYSATNNGDGTWVLADNEVNSLLDGTYDVAVVAIDLVGNLGIDDTTNELLIDTEAPTVTVNELSTNDPSPLLTGDIDDPDALVQVTIGRNSYEATNVGDGTWILADGTIAPDLADGVYDIEVVASDRVNNIGTDATTDELRIDATAPVVTVNTLLTTDITPELTGTVDDTTATIEVTVNGTSYTATNNQDGTWTLADGIIAPDLDNGVYDIEVTATDGFDNVGTDDTTNELVIDTVAPVVTVTDLSTNDNTPTLTGTLNDSTADLEITVNGVVFTVTDVGNGTWSFTLPEPLDDGTYNVMATATDAVGNVGTDTTSNELFIDTIAPQIGINSRRTNDPTPALSGTVNDPTATVQVGIGLQAFTATNNGNGTWTLPNNVITTPLTDGIYDIKAVATDRVGNSSLDTTTNELTIDQTPPTVNIVNVTPDPRGPVSAIAINFSERVSGLNVSDFTLTRDGVPVSLAGATLQSGNGINWTLGNLSDVTALTADYTLTLRAGSTNITDSVGNLLQRGATDSWSVVNFTADGLPAPASINGQLGSAPSPINFRGGKRGIRRQGGSGADRLIGTNGRDRLEGRGGRDRLFGQRGNDRLLGDNGNDRLFGGGGADRLKGGNGNDRLEGEGGRDRLEGGKGRDRLLGGRGSDILIGGGGRDRLTGNGGRDQFVFEDLNDGVDTITDFNTNDDLIDLSGILSSSQFAAASDFAKITQFVRLRQVGTSTEISIDADGNGSGTALQAIVVLEGINSDAIVSTNFLA